ncbi:C4-dicarboxylate TRAP transporter large permease protein DctM [subsurface metagenome]
MNPVPIELITVVMFGSLLILLLMGLPVAFTCGGLAVMFILVAAWQGWLPMGFMNMLAVRTYGLMYQYLLFAIPLFIFLASMMEQAGIIEEMYDAFQKWTGPLPGGLASATVLASTLLAAVVGIIGAAVVTMGLIALPSMLKKKYQPRLACGAVMAGGTLGILIPPSILFIMYALVAGESCGKLFAGGIGPGLVLSALYCTYITIRCTINPELGPPLTKEERKQVTWAIKFKGLLSIAFPTILVFAVLGSIFLGVASITEAAAVGGFGAMIAAALKGKLTWGNLKTAMNQTVKVTAMVLWVCFGAVALVTFYYAVGGEIFIRDLIWGFELGKYGTLAVMMGILVILGMFVDWVGILFLCVPIFLPIIIDLGFDRLWFGIIYNVNMQIGFLSPPFGYALFYLKGVAPPEIKMTEIIRAVLPFIGLQVIGLAIVIAFPPIAIWLPNWVFAPGRFLH